MTNKKTAFDLLQDLDYIYQTATLKFMGKAVIDADSFKATLEALRTSVSEELEKARKVEVRQEKIYAEAETKSQLLLQSTETMISELDIVKEAELIAASIVDKANSEAAGIVKEATQTSDNTISHGENVKNELITQGYNFLEDVLRKNLMEFDQQQTNLINEQTNFINAMEQHRETLINAYLESFPEQAEANIKAS